MSSIEDLKAALQEALENRGYLDQLKAQVRSEIFATLHKQEPKKQELSNENLIINELIREYLEYNKHKHTLSVFLTEVGQPKEPLGRSFLTTGLNFSEDNTSRSRPLLYSLVKRQQQLHAQANKPKATTFTPSSYTTTTTPSSSYPASSSYPSSYPSYPPVPAFSTSAVSNPTLQSGRSTLNNHNHSSVPVSNTNNFYHASNSNVNTINSTSGRDHASSITSATTSLTLNDDDDEELSIPYVMISNSRK